MFLERTHNLSIVEDVLNHPMVKPSLTDSEDWNVVVDVPQIHFLLVLNEQRDVLGLYILIPYNSVTYSVHSAFLPEGMISGTSEAAELLKQYIFVELGAEKVITQVPAFNYLARAYCQRVKLKLEGTLVKSYLHGGKLHDIYLYGLTKEEYLCQQ